MSLTDNSSEVANAYHESAHAYFCHLFGQQIETVSIDGQSVTQLASPTIDHVIKLAHGDLSINNNIIAHFTVIRLAGPVAESIFSGQTDWLDSEQSYYDHIGKFISASEKNFDSKTDDQTVDILAGSMEDIFQIMDMIDGTQIEGHTLEFLFIMLKKTRDAIVEHWMYIENIAKSLLEKRTLSHYDITKIVNGLIE